MKKPRFLIPLLPLLVLLAGCKEKPTGCVEYAPADVSISWTDYNSVADVVGYFHCHKKTAERHEGDTLKVKGFVCKDYPYPNWWMSSHNIEPGYFNQIMLAGSSTRQGSDNSLLLPIVFSEDFAEQFRQNMEEYLEKEWFVTGQVHSGESGFGPISCCSYMTWLQAINVEFK